MYLKCKKLKDFQQFTAKIQYIFRYKYNVAFL